MHLLRRDRNPTMRELLREWQVEYYDPSRANAVGDAFYSESRRAWVKQNEIKLPSEVLPRLAEACDAPDDKNGEVKMYAVATQARTWLGFAFGELIQALPADDDDHAPEAARAAMAAELRHQVGALLKHMVFGEGAHCTPWAGNRRALGTWVHWVALCAPGQWKRFGSHDVQGRIDGDGFRIALKPSLAGQVAKSQHPEIAAMSEPKFSKRCDRAGIRANDRDNILNGADGRSRWTILTAEFVASLDLALDHGEVASDDETAGQVAGSEGKGFFKNAKPH